MDGQGNAPQAKPTIAEIQRVVCARKGLTLDQMKSCFRYRKLAHPRQVAMALARELTGKSYPQLGRAFGGRDHTTCLYAYRKINRIAAANADLEIELARYREAIMRAVESRRRTDRDAWASLGGELESA